jgi:mannan endo-1,4-beta-mannosidase
MIEWKTTHPKWPTSLRPSEIFTVSITIRSFVLTLALGIVIAAGGATAPPDTQFIRQRGGKLYAGDDEFRFISWNVPNLLVLEDAFDFLGTSPWRWPDEFELTDALESVRQMGGTVVRPYVITVRRDDSDMGEHVHVLAPGKFNEEAFATLDLALAIARKKQVRVIIPLVDNWRWQGGIEQYAAFRGKTADQFWTDPQLIDDFLKTVEYVVNRRNTITGVRYRDDPTIFGWETGNELEAPAEWTRKVAAYIKSIDPNHLVIDGRSLKGITPESLSDPNIDVVTTHHYPNAGNNAQAVLEAARAVGGKKAYFVGEFGFLDVGEAQRMLDVVIDERISGALYWSLRYHRREGGFYWHHEPSGGDLFKAYHWPGFSSGHEYREHLVLPMVRDAAFRIRNLPVPPVPVPAAPHLLPIDDVARISWQGSAGASGYDVQRSESADGPWSTVGVGVSDAAVQYRPLFSDSSAEPAQRYWYRVVARNTSGDSPHSNIVGPIEVQHLTLVDELADLTKIAKVSGVHELRRNAARTVQEDIHRLALKPPAELTYEVPGEVQSVRVWLFTAGPAVPLAMAAAPELGANATAVLTGVTTNNGSTGDYEYLRPVLVEADQIPARMKAIRLSLPQNSDATEVQISRVEIKYNPRGHQ